MCRACPEHEKREGNVCSILIMKRRLYRIMRVVAKGKKVKIKLSLCLTKRHATKTYRVAMRISKLIVEAQERDQR
jgi:hypothetical protein